MNTNIKQSFQNMPKHIAIIGAFLAGIIVAGVVFWVSRSDPKADTTLMPRAARIEKVEGSVGIAHAQAQAQKEVAESEWVEATRNVPLTTGDRVYAREGSRATVAFTGRNHARLDSGSALDVLSLADRRTQLALRNGSATFDIGELEDGELFEVGTPYGAIDFQEPGLYQMGIGDDSNVWISVLSGLAQVIGSGGIREISKGEILTLAGQAATQMVLSKIAPEYAGGIVNDYYSDRYPDTYDGRYRDYDTYLEDPDYYDPYSRSASYRYVSDDIPGVYDLDDYGDWSEVDGYGHCWTPRVDTDWVPYRNGFWDVGSAYGPTWVSQEPWGWAPYHYGRWAYVNNRQWIWVPDRVERVVYAPALVAFVPMTRTQQIGWVPLAPGEQYVPRYYDADFQPQYFGSPEVVAQVINVQQTYINYSYPQAITVVPVQDFTRVVETRGVTSVNPQYMALSQPLLDPYAIDSLRKVAMAGDNGRAKFKMARAFREQVLNTPVVTSVDPVVLPGRENITEALPVATVSEKQKRNKMKVQESGQVITANAPNGWSHDANTQPKSAAATQARDQQVAELVARSAQGDRTARRELKRLAREQNAEPQGAQQPSTGQAHGKEFKAMNNQPEVEAVQNPRKAQRQLDRQQMNTVEQQRKQMQQPVQEPSREQRKAQKRAEAQRNGMMQAQPMGVGQQESQKQQIEQRRAQKQAARSQQVNPPQAIHQQQINQQRQMKQQMKQQRQLQEQQIQQQRVPEQVNQQRQMKQQMKQQRQMQQQQMQQRQIQEQQMQQRQMQKQQMRQMQQRQQQIPQGNPSVAVPQTDRQQRKAERRAMQEQARPQVVQPQQTQKPVEFKGPPVRYDAGNPSQRKAEKAQRKAGKGNQ